MLNESSIIDTSNYVDCFCGRWYMLNIAYINTLSCLLNFDRHSYNANGKLAIITIKFTYRLLMKLSVGILIQEHDKTIYFIVYFLVISLITKYLFTQKCHFCQEHWKKDSGSIYIKELSIKVVCVFISKPLLQNLLNISLQ